MGNRHTKPKNIEKFLTFIQTEALNRKDLQLLMGLHQTTVDEYITELHEKKLIFIEKYEKTLGQPRPYWKAGSKNDIQRERGKHERLVNNNYRIDLLIHRR